MAEPSLSLAIAQDVFLPGEVDTNLRTIATALSKAKEAGADIVVLPELATSGYFTGPEITDLAEPIDGPVMTRVRELTTDAGVALCVGYPEVDEATGTVYNSAALLDAGGNVLANHRKTHLWGDERKRFTAADRALTSASFGGFEVAILICYEIEFPELVRKAALAGADLVLTPTAVADFGTTAAFTRQIVGARATENNIFIAYVNHSGVIDGLQSLGSSVVAAPLCRLPVTAETDPTFRVTTLDRADLVEARKRLPYLDDRRPELY